MEAAARSNLKPVSLELGGKSPLIIFNDADINFAIDTAKNAIFFNKVYTYILFLKIPNFFIVFEQVLMIYAR